MSAPEFNNLFFRGLVSRKLGPERLIDDELILSLLESADFHTLCKEYAANRQEDGVAARVLSKAAELRLPGAPHPHAWAVWSAVMEDPRFDLIWKEALDELNEPLPVSRNSLFARLLRFLAKFKPAEGAVSAVPLVLGTAVLTSAAWWTARPAAPSTPSLPTEITVTDSSDNTQTLRQRHDRPNQSDAQTSVDQKVDVWPSESTDALGRYGQSQSQSLHVDLKNLQQSLDAQTASARWEMEKTRDVLQELEKDANEIDFAANHIAGTTDQNLEVANQTRSAQVNAANLADALKAPRKTVKGLRRGSAFGLADGKQSICFSVEKLNASVAVVRFRQGACRPAGVFPPGADYGLLRLTNVPRLVPPIDDKPTGLYLSLEIERGNPVIPAVGKTSTIGVYSLDDWHQAPP